MKKLFAILMVAAIVLSLGAVVVSADFVESPGHGTEDGGEDIIITHIDDINNADPRVDRDNFQQAIDELKGAEDLKDLNKDIKDDATVRDVFDVTFVDDALEDDKNNVTFDVNYSDDNYQVIIRTDDGWKVIPSVRNADGTVTVTLTGNAVVAFLSVPAQSDGPVSEPTGDGIAAIIACLAVVGVAGSAVLLRRKNLEK
ncbi:MAG: hypothetical protein IJA52_02840 [Clostridia bacterium]|nr:hypothetical protein [Clostridia bacterium]